MPSYWIVIIVAAVAAVASAGLGFFVLLEDNSIEHRSAASAVFEVAKFILLGGVCASISGLTLIVVVLALKDQLKGPYLVFSPVRRTFELSRAELTFAAADVLRWRAVTGIRVGLAGRQKKWDYPVSELQLIVKRPDGAMAHPVVGWSRESLAQTLDRLAEATSLPIEHVQQDQAITMSSQSAIQDR